MNEKIDPRWPLVTVSLLVGGVGLCMFVQSRSPKDGVILFVALVIVALVTSVVEILTDAGIVTEKVSPKRLRGIFFTRPFFWCYTVLPCVIGVILLVWVILKMLPSSVFDAFKT